MPAALPALVRAAPEPHRAARLAMLPPCAVVFLVLHTAAPGPFAYALRVRAVLLRVLLYVPTVSSSSFSGSIARGGALRALARNGFLPLFRTAFSSPTLPLPFPSKFRSPVFLEVP